MTDQLRCCVIFYGVARSARWTLPSIRRNVIAPIGRSGAALATVAHFNAPATIDNARSNERNVPFIQPDYAAFNADAMAVEPQDDESVAALLERFRHHDIIAGTNGTVGTHRNLLHALTSLQKAWRLAIESGHGNADIFVVLRSDLYYLDPWPFAFMAHRIRSGEMDIIVPDWHCFRGINDRFAIGNRHAIAAYANRIDIVPRVIDEGIPRNAEMMAALALSDAGVGVGFTPCRAMRVRANGQTRTESFDLSFAQRVRNRLRPLVAPVLTI